MLPRLAERLAGKFVVLDGPDGSGKGTQLQMLESGLMGVGGKVVRAKDPGGTAIGSRIRQLVLGQDLTTMDIHCEALLFMASRAQLVAEVVRPALAEGRTVLCDRFISATFAYQGAAGLDRKQIRQLGDLSVGRTWPDITIVLDVPAEVGLARVGRAQGGPSSSPSAGQYTIFEDAVGDAMERRPVSFHRRVREIFRQLPEFYPRLVVLVDGTGSVPEVHQAVLEALAGADF